MKNGDDIGKFELDKWIENFVNKQCPEGESFIDLYERLKAFINV